MGLHCAGSTQLREQVPSRWRGSPQQELDRYQSEGRAGKLLVQQRHCYWGTIKSRCGDFGMQVPAFGLAGAENEQQDGDAG